MKEYSAWIQSEVSAFNNLTYKKIERPPVNDNEILIETKASTRNVAE